MLKLCAQVVKRNVKVMLLNKPEVWNVDLPEGKDGWALNTSRDYQVITTFTPNEEYRAILAAQDVHENEEESRVLDGLFETYNIPEDVLTSVSPAIQPEDTQTIHIDGRELYSPTMLVSIEDNSHLVIRIDDYDERNLEFWQVLRIPLPVLRLWLEQAELVKNQTQLISSENK